MDFGISIAGASDSRKLEQRVEALPEAGWNQFVIAISPGQERAIEGWARIRRAFD